MPLLMEFIDIKEITEAIEAMIIELLKETEDATERLLQSSHHRMPRRHPRSADASCWRSAAALSAIDAIRLQGRVSSPATMTLCRSRTWRRTSS
jgi:predicted lipoprotein